MFYFKVLLNFYLKLIVILLASESPQRKKILNSINASFEVTKTNFDETVLKEALKSQNLLPVDLVSKLANGKLKSIITEPVSKKYAMVLTADTMIFVDDNTPLGKPQSEQDAKDMLLSYSNKNHQVITALAGYNTKTQITKIITSTSSVYFEQLSDEAIKLMIDSKEWQNVAGAYRIQGLASLFIKKIEGSYTGIVGLPTHEFYHLTRELNINKSEIFNSVIYKSTCT